METQDRHLAWDGCLNVRDLGGHPTAGGDRTKFGRIVRSDALHGLTDSGWRELDAHGIRTVVDLRFQEERDADPPHDVPIEPVHVSLLGELDSGHWPEIDAVSTSAPDHAAATEAVYLEFLERFRPNFARAIAAIATAPAGGVLIHCQGGKDRTGLVAALLLRLADVPIEDVAADYGLSAENLRQRSEEWFAAAADEAERERRRRIAVSPPESMRGVLEQVERRYGGARAYLRGGGASDADLEAARARLLG